MTPISDIAAERALWMSLAWGIEHGEPVLDQLKDAGLKKEWFHNSAIRIAITGAMRLHLQSKTVSLLALMSHCSNDGIGKAGWDSLSTAWIDASRSDPIQWQQFVPNLRELALTRTIDGVLMDLQEQRKQDPRGVKTWMPHFLMRLRTALESGQDYDPTPSVIWQKGVPTKVVASTGLNTLDEVYRGGLRNGMVALWVVPTGHGKSRLTYTLASFSVGQKHRVAVITTEARPFDVVAGTLQSWLKLTDKEVESKADSMKGLVEESLSELDKYLFVWGRDKGKAAEIEEILYWVKPTHLILDHQSAMAKYHRSTKYQREDQVIADFADFLEEAAVKHECTITVFAEMSDKNTKLFKKNHNLHSAAAFGSSVPEKRAHIGIIAMRHWSKVNTLYGLVKKDRLKGQIDTEFTLKHDPQTHSFYEVAE